MKMCYLSLQFGICLHKTYSFSILFSCINLGMLYITVLMLISNFFQANLLLKIRVFCVFKFQLKSFLPKKKNSCFKNISFTEKATFAKNSTRTQTVSKNYVYAIGFNTWFERFEPLTQLVPRICQHYVADLTTNETVVKFHVHCKL